MTTYYLGQTIDQILGQEFLTWLWFKSDKGHTFSTKDNRQFTVSMGNKVVVQGGEGEQLETASVSGPDSELREARLGLKVGKKVTAATVHFDHQPERWSVNLKAADMALGSMKTPRVDSRDMDDPEGAFLEKMYLIDTAIEMLDVVFAEFMAIRLGEEWQREAAIMKKWIMEAA